MDSYSCHCSNEVMKFLNTHKNIFTAMIPGGLTYLMQPLDVCINAPFKKFLKTL